MYESNRTEWSYISGKVCVLESFLLKQDFFERLTSLEKHEEVFLSLGDSPLKDHFGHIEYLYEFERILEKRYLNKIYEIRRSSPDPVLSNIFLIKYDFVNLKNFLKELLAGVPREVPHPFPGVGETGCGDSEWDRLWKGKSTDLDPIYEDAIKIIKENLEEAKAKGSALAPPFIIDLALDNAYLCYLGQMVSKLDVPLISEYFETYFTIKGTEIILRVLGNKREKEQISKIFLRGLMQKDFFFKFMKCRYEGCPGTLREVLPYELVYEIFAGPRKSLFTRFERLANNYLLRKLYPARFAPFGAERVFGYLCGLTTETYNLRLTLGGKVNMVNIGLIKERLREPYV